MPSTVLWYLTRATGIVALVLLTGTVMLGVVGTARAATGRWPRVITASLHRNVALLSMAFVGVHVVTTVLDPFVSISLIAAFVPFSSDYRPLWLSLGAVSFDLLLAVLITSLLRDRLSHRLWQAVHLLVYLCWPVALWHGLGTGTDSRLPWVLVIDLACMAGVGWAVWWRLRIAGSSVTRTAGLAALVLVPLLTAIFVILGPLQPGWSRRAGTPAALLGSQVGTPPSSARGGQPARPGRPLRLSEAPFTGRMSVRSEPAAGERTITITGRTVAAPGVAFVIILRGTPSGSGISLTSGTVRIGQPGAGQSWSGPVVQLTSGTLIAEVSGPAGKRRAEFLLRIRDTAVTGTVSLIAPAVQ